MPIALLLAIAIHDQAVGGEGQRRDDVDRADLQDARHGRGVSSFRALGEREFLVQARGQLGAESGEGGDEEGAAVQEGPQIRRGFQHIEHVVAQLHIGRQQSQHSQKSAIGSEFDVGRDNGAKVLRDRRRDQSNHTAHQHLKHSH